MEQLPAGRTEGIGKERFIFRPDGMDFGPEQLFGARNRVNHFISQSRELSADHRFFARHMGGIVLPVLNDRGNDE